VILAGAGDDLMSGGSGSDVLDGGEGTDTLQLSNSYDDYNISFDGEQIIVSGPEGVDTVTGVELLEFADGTLAVEDIGLEPVVSLTTFGSDEDTAIAIDIGVYVANPFEGVATVSISGVPECADLLAGTDNGGGNWTLSAGDLDGLTVTPPQDFFGQLDLSVSATSTEGVTSLAAPLPVDFAAVNDAPVLEGDETLEVDTGGTATITSEDFNVTDVDNDPSDITYTVTDGPDNGTLFLDGDALDEDDIFTQEDIDNGLLQYTADEAGFSWAENTPSWDEGGAPVDQSNLTVPETAEGVTVVFEGESAENHNTVGWYKLDENGDPMEPQVLFVDASEEGNTLEKGTEITLEGLEPGEQFGFFIIQDGANKYPNLAEAVEAGVPLNFDDNGNITFESSALVGTDDNDVLTGGIGADIIDGGDGDDTIIGGSDDDYLYGGEGDDVLSGGAGNDIIDGGCDDDTLILSGNLEDYIITRVGGTFTIEDTREDGDGTDRVEHVEEFEFADQTLSKDDLRNESENLEQRGNRGDNELTGTDGDDKLKGDRGDDILEGGAGDDEIKGGSGDDTAVFSGDLSDYTITQDGDSFFVSDNREDGDGTDEVKEVKSFQFNDQTVSKDDMEDIAEKVSGEHSSVTIEASNIFFTGEGLNTDGANHAISGTNDDGNLMIGFEDLTGGGDNDFNDATISVKYEGVDNGATADTFGIKASDGEDELQENDGSDGGYSVTDGEAAVSVVIDPSGIG
jgi:Ca2+-binding RTX toxin-like protein